ncbi:MAG TPA: hypothetical protein VNV87_07455 [Acidimicrobiales bacterium]|jgi:hypothetical protein|nr:hypothetical protein [Acidimicrobiales bacterium]
MKAKTNEQPNESLTQEQWDLFFRVCPPGAWAEWLREEAEGKGPTRDDGHFAVGVILSHIDFSASSAVQREQFEGGYNAMCEGWPGLREAMRAAGLSWRT